MFERRRRALFCLAGLLLCCRPPAFAHQEKQAPMIAHTLRLAAWPDEQNGYATMPLPEGAGGESVAAGDWFAGPEITVDGAPFRVAPARGRALATTRAGEETLSVALHGRRVGEVLLLVDADFPSTEMLGIDTNQPTGLDVLDEPERCLVEVEDASGRVNGYVPIDAATGTYGLRRGLRLYAVHTNDLGDLRALRFRDRMTNAVFTLAGVTLRAGKPHVAEPPSRSVQYPPVKKPPLAACGFAFDTTRGLTWSHVASPMLGGQKINLTGQPVFTLRLGDTAVPSTAWTVKNVRASRAATVVTLTYQALRAVFSARKSRQNETLLNLEITNDGPDAVQGSLLFPEIGPVALGAPADTWYFTSAYGGIFHHAPAEYKTFTRGVHPLSLDGVFSPKAGAGLAFLPRDRDGVFRWYHVAKDARGCRYALEYLPETVGKGEHWTTLPVVVAAVPGDWKDQLAYYRKGAATWYKPATPRKAWFERVFAFDTHHPYAGDAGADADFARSIARRKAEVGASDFLHLFAWAMTDTFGHWGEYSHFFQYSSANPAAPLNDREADGKRRFAAFLRAAQAAGTPMGLYLDSNLYSTKATTLTPEQIEAWAQRNAKGDKVSNYDNSVSMFLQAQGWRDYLAGRYASLEKEIGPRGFYIDELGGSLPEHVHYVNRHGIITPAAPTRGERQMLEQVRSALPPETALYTEFYPPDTFLPLTDGAFSYVFMMRYKGREAFWTPPRDPQKSSDVVAPHYLNLMRFAFPDVKTFHIVYSTPHENGNWFLLRYPFFNGDGQYLKAETRGHTDAAARAFYQKTFALQHAHADAFTSRDVEPLVPTQHPDLYANRFGTTNETVWTLFNAGYQTQRGPLLVVSHRPGARYVDAWTGRPVAAKIRGRSAELSFEIGPRAVGCLVQEVPR